MPPPPVRKEIVLAMRAPSAVPVAQPKGRKRKFTKHGDGESSKQGGSSIASELRGKVCRSLKFLFFYDDSFYLYLFSRFAFHVVDRWDDQRVQL